MAEYQRNTISALMKFQIFLIKDGYTGQKWSQSFCDSVIICVPFARLVLVSQNPRIARLGRDLEISSDFTFW